MNLKALIVGDNVINRETVRLVVETLGYDVHEAVNSLNALKHMEVQTFDLLVFDLKLLESDSFGILQEIRKLRQLYPMKVVFMTAEHELAADIEDDLDYIMYKPIDVARFIAFVMRLVLQKASDRMEHEIA